jgi:hypothetical protein
MCTESFFVFIFIFLLAWNSCALCALWWLNPETRLWKERQPAFLFFVEMSLDVNCSGAAAVSSAKQSSALPLL